LDRHQLEYDLTWRYLNQYLPSNGSILEIGAATGRYTLGLARRSYSVTAVDLSARNIDVCQKSLAEAGLEGQVQLVLAGARDLREVTEKGFDAVLLMGPFYRLIEEADRRRALKEAADRLRDGGILSSAFISRFGVLGDLMKKLPDWVENKEEVRSLLELGRSPENALRDGGFRGYFAKVSEIAPLLEALGFETLALVEVEPAISADDKSYNKLEGEQRRRWLDLLYEISAEESISGASRHLLYIGRKSWP
jgi:SAM-dependent methyltransferase